MPGRRIRVARIAGIPIGISPWWLVVVALITWSLGSSYFPDSVADIAPAAAYGLALASTLLLFASILLHELGHAIVARRHGIEVVEIDLWLLGGVAQMRGEAHDPNVELRYALAGPAVSAIIAACFGVLRLLLPASAPAALRAVVDYQLLVNALILGFNLLPAFPLDGGRVLRALLWRHSGDMRSATRTAASAGRAFGWALIALGALEVIAGGVGGIWLAVIGTFLIIASRAQAYGAEVIATLSGIPARDLMSAPVVTIAGDLTVAQAVSGYFVPYRFTAFPVVDADGRAIGIVSARRVEALAPGDRVVMHVEQIADREADLLVDAEQDIAALLELPAFGRIGRAVVVDPNRRPLGLLSITDVERTLRASRLQHPPTTTARTG